MDEVHKEPHDGATREEGSGRGAMDPVPGRETMRRLGYLAVDHVVERWASLEDGPPWGTASPERTRDLIHGPPPEVGEPVEGLMEEAIRNVFPFAGRIDHPRFVGFVPSSPAWSAVLGEILVAGHNVFQGTWLESAGPSQVELTVLEWFRSWLGMPEGAGGILTSGGSVANLLAVVTAREVAGWPSEPMVYLSDQGHNSLGKAARTAGIRAHQVRVLPTGPDRVLRAEVVARAVEEDRREGRTPILVCANGGATNTGTVDPLEELARLSREVGVRLHVDAAYGGFAVLTERGAGKLAGLALADSVTLDPHKWLFQTYECGCLMVRDPGELEAAFRLSADYLQDTRTRGGEVNFGDRGVQLTRQFRALKVWLTVRALGTRTLARAMDAAMDTAARAEERIRGPGRLELLHPAQLGVVCFRYRPDPEEGGSDWSEEALDALNRKIQSRMLEEGHAMMSSTRIDGRFSLRLCILNHRTRWRHVADILHQVERLGGVLSRRSGGDR
jgi:aromatic-L-amino-acid/L-tryptophan decarboxylase